MKRRLIKTIKADQLSLLKAYHAKNQVLEEELKVARKYKQDHCPHPPDKVRIKSNGWPAEPGRGGAIDWEEKVCRRCGKLLATSHKSEKTVWSDAK